MSGRTRTHTVLHYVSGQKNLTAHRFAASSNTARIPPCRRGISSVDISVNLSSPADAQLARCAAWSSMYSIISAMFCQNSVTISRRSQGDLVDGVSRQSVQRKRVECRQETRTGNTAVGYRRTGRKMLRRRSPRRNHRIGKSEDPSDPSDDHAYSPPMIQYSPKSNALVHWRQTLSTHCHRGQP